MGKNLLKEDFKEYLSFVIAGVVGGLIVAAITDRRIEEIWGDAKYGINFVFFCIVFGVGFFAYLLTKRTKEFTRR